MENNKFNKILLACNAVLLLGLVGIYILHFTGNNGGSKVNANAKAPVVKEGGLKIAYVDTDTLLANYQYAKDLEAELLTYKNQQEQYGKQQMEKFQKDYQDYLKRKGLKEWFGSSGRFDDLHRFCQHHSRWDDYRPLMERMNDEELANMAICLCHQVDAAMAKYIERKDREFTTEGGIRERMTAARL